MVDVSVGSVLSFSHEENRFNSRHGHLFVLLLIRDLIDCLTDEHECSNDLRWLSIDAGAIRLDDQKLLTVT